MPVPISQAFSIATYIIREKFRGNRRYPLVLMLEPLFSCNLECAGCGKIQYPGHILKRHLTPEQCFRAVEECRAPIVSIAGGEPLIHPQIKEIVEGMVARRKYVYLCTNALLLGKKMDLFTPSNFLTLSIHLDGLQEEHDHSVCRQGTFENAKDVIREALRRGFRVDTNTTLFLGAEPSRVHKFFDLLTELGVEGMTISPGYSYSHAPDQHHFLQSRQTQELFIKLLGDPNPKWVFNQSPLFLEFLMGRRHYECTPWGTPCYNIFGWQWPCYLLDEGYAATFRELMDETDWSQYGWKSGNRKCANCMMHCGYEPTAVNDTFSHLEPFWTTVKLTLLGIRASKVPAKGGASHRCVSHIRDRNGNGDGKDVSKEEEPVSDGKP